MARPEIIDKSQKESSQGTVLRAQAAILLVLVVVLSMSTAQMPGAHTTPTASQDSPAMPQVPPPGRYALSFDGVDDFLEIHASRSLQLGRHFTIQMWIKARFPEISSPQKSRAVLSKGGYILGNPDDKGNRRAFPYGFGLHLTPEDNSTVVVSPYTGAEGGIYGTDCITTHEPGWQHLVLSSSNIGYHVSTRSPEAYTPAPASHLLIGRDTGLHGINGFAGDIGELRIWNRELTVDEINAYKQIPLTGNEPNLVACWPFEQERGQDATDISPYNNRARLGTSYRADKNDPTWTSVTD
jgi:hypothetical protein